MKMRNLQYSFFTAGELKPSGWLRDQLTCEAEGLAGNLDKVWPDIRDSMWIGGERDGWERVPYWLDGFIPLAYLLDNEDMKERAKKYIYAIIDRSSPDGWLCPCAPSERRAYDPWAALLLFKVLSVYCAESGDEKAEKALYRALRQFNQHLDGQTLHNWGAARWFEGLIPVFYMYEKTGEDWLLLLAKKLDVQGFDWQKVFEKDADGKNMLDELTKSWDYISHVVNLGMMLKSRSLMSRITGEDPDKFAAEALAYLHEKHGMATGHFTGDENLSGTSPIQGSELCSVVEAMYSFEQLFSVSGNTRWLDMLEREAFNALPATFSPDMWTHQYVQLTNQVECSRLPKRVFRTNDEEAHIFGLEPNYGCCTANMVQGYPKFALTAYMKKSGGGVLAALPVPSALTTVIDGKTVSFTTGGQYPFTDRIVYTVETQEPVEFTFDIRIPSCDSATLDGKQVAGGKIVSINELWNGRREIILDLCFDVKLTKRPSGLYCLNRGPLLFSLPIKENWKKREYESNGVERKFPYCDYYVYPESDWNMAFTDDYFTVEHSEVIGGITPFSPQTAPLRIKARLVHVDWKMPDGRCALLPESNIPVSDAEEAELIPYGATCLRMTEMPVAEIK